MYKPNIDLQTADAQQVFDFVVTHLLSMKKRASDGANCYYLLPQKDGSVLMCAVGCLIPDDMYSEKFEGIGIRKIITEHIHEFGYLKYFHKFSQLIFVLQNTHDRDGFWNHDGINTMGIDRLKDIAHYYGLEYRF